MIEILVLAGGRAERFGSNKLLADLNGTPMVLHVPLRLQWDRRFHVTVVTCHGEVRKLCKANGISCVFSEECLQGLSGSIRAGVQALAAEGAEAICFCAGDQPFLKADTLAAFHKAWKASGKSMGSCLAGDDPTNPAIFSKECFPALLSLEGDQGGRRILREDPEDCFYWPLPDPCEARDIDTLQQYQKEQQA